MAQVPVSGGPTIAPSAAPLPRQNIQASPEAFGATAIGQGGSALGAVATQGSSELESYANQFQALNNKQAADSSFVKVSQQLDDFAANYKANNAGMSAYTNLGDAYKQLDDIRTSGSEGLSPMAAVEYEANSRRAMSYAQSNLRDFAVGQRKSSIIGTSNAKIQTAQAAMVASPDDPDVQAQSIQSIAGEAAFQSRPDVLGLSDEQGKAFLQDKLGAAFQGQIRTAIDAGNYPKAQVILADHKDDMTEGQITSVMGALKVGQNAFIANSERMAAMSGTAPSIPNQTPQGAWDAGLAKFKADPAGTISDLVGGPVTITSGARTTAGNAAAGGSPTSEHLSGNAWDFVPQRGNITTAAMSLAANMHEEGIPFDQIEIDSANGHVHVGFGQKNRNEIIDQNGTVLQSSVAVAPNGPAPPDLRISSPAQDVDEYESNSIKAIQDYVDTKYAGNPTLGQQVNAALIAGMRQNSLQLRTTQDATSDRLLSAMVGQNGSPPIQDVGTLSTAYPGAAGDLAALPPKNAIALQRDLTANANAFTPQRQLNIQVLEGMKQSDPAAFSQANIPAMDLPISVKTSYMKQQADVRSKVQHQVQEDSVIQKTLGSVQAQAALSGLGITKKDSPEQYYQFAGALQGAYESYTASNKKPPDQKAMDGIITQVTAQTSSGFLGLGKTTAFQVPSEAETQIRAAFAKRGLNPTQQDIGRMYWGKRYGQ